MARRARCPGLRLASAAARRDWTGVWTGVWENIRRRYQVMKSVSLWAPAVGAVQGQRRPHPAPPSKRRDARACGGHRANSAARRQGGRSGQRERSGGGGGSSLYKWREMRPRDLGLISRHFSRLLRPGSGPRETWVVCTMEA